MENSHGEELLSEVEQLVLGLSPKEKADLVKSQGIWKEEYTTRSRLRLAKILENHLEAKLRDSKEEGIKLLQEIKEELLHDGESSGSETDADQHEVKVAVALKECQDLKGKHEELVLQQQEEMKKTSKGNLWNGAEQQPEVKAVFRREFKISGQIGEPGQKDKLSFTSLARQIESGLAKGFKESEVVGAVIKDLSASMRLRSYLESITDLPLSRLRQILRSHYRERSAIDLHQQLATIAQETNEDPQSFLVRALDIRQKLLFASQAEDTAERLSRVYFYTIETGLRDDSIRMKLRPQLQESQVTDETLLQQISSIVAAEKDHKNKLGPRSRAHVSKLDAMDQGTTADSTETTEKVKEKPR